MSYTFKLSGGTADEKQIARVRDEIDDVTSVETPVEGTHYFLSDERILRRLADVAEEASTDANRALLAAASALETLSTNQAYVLKKKSTLQEDVDGPAVAAAIMKHAASLKARVQASEAKLAEKVVAEDVPQRGARVGSQTVTVRRVW